MKVLKRFSMFFLSLAFLFGSVPVGSVHGAYTYTVSFYAGEQGSFSGGGGVRVLDRYGADVTSRMSVDALSGGDRVRVSGLPYRSVILFSDLSDSSGGNSLVLKDPSLYYLRGVKRSGMDNDSCSGAAVTVTGDLDVVCAYGIRSDKMVPYTVRYTDGSGRELISSQTFYGRIGDKPAVSFSYISGWRPAAYNLTKTLSANEAENVFTFVYFRVQQQPQRPSGGGQGQSQGNGSGQVAAGTSGNGNQSGNGTNIPGTQVPNGNGQNAGQQGQVGTQQGQTGAGQGSQQGQADVPPSGNVQDSMSPSPQGSGSAERPDEGFVSQGGTIQDMDEPQEDDVKTADEPQDLVDLDENPTPLMPADEAAADEDGGIPAWGWVFIVLAVISAIAGIVFFVLRRERMRDEGYDEEDE